MNAALTDLQKQLRAQLAKLAEAQQAIAVGRPLPFPEEGERELRYKHPTEKGLYLVQYPSGGGTWRLYYRTRSEQKKRTFDCGDANVTTVKQAEKAAQKARHEVEQGRDPQADRKELRSKYGRLAMLRLERTDPGLAKQVTDKELTVAQAAAKAGIRVKQTVRGLCEEYLEDKAQPIHKQKGLTKFTEISPDTLRNYRGFAKHLGTLGDIPFDELEKRRNEISRRVQQIEKELSWQSARHFKSMLSSVYIWALKVYPDDIKVNPVPGTYVAERPPENRDDDDHKHLLWSELAKVWRASVTMGEAAPRTYKGNAWGATAIPTGANSVRDDSTLLTIPEMERQSGWDRSIFYRGLKDKSLIVHCRRRDLPDDHPANHPLKITQGKGHASDFMFEAAEMRRFMESRADLMRSPQYEYSVIIRLLMLLGLRYQQIGGLRWSELGELDGDRFVPSTKISVLRQKPLLKDGARRRGMKAKYGEGSTLLRYLPPLAVELINTIERKEGRDLVFGTGPRGMIENDRYKKQLDQIVETNEKAEPLRDWNLHMMRHSFTTLMSNMNCPPHIVSMMLNHTFSEGAAATKGYNHATYIDAQKKWMNSWVTKLLNEVHGTDKTNVVPGPGNLQAESA